MKHRSNLLTGTPGGTDWARRAAARAMLRAVDFSEDDFSKPIVTLACPFTNATPCNDHIRKLGDILFREIVSGGGKPFLFGTPVISDGETMGMEGMKYSLMSRDLIADCIETMHEGYAADGIVTLSGCDKSIPGALMPILRNNGIGLTLYGGTILPGRYKGEDLTIVSAFEAIGAHAAGRMTDEELRQVECHSCPGGQDIFASPDSPYAPPGRHISVLRGNLAPEEAVLKLSGKELSLHSGPARVFDREEDALDAILAGNIKEGRRDRDQVRGSERRARDAGDAVPVGRADGRGAGERRRAGHRREVFWRHARDHGRARRPGGAGGGSHRRRP